MFDTDNDLVKHALNMWANSIETGDNFLSANDVMEMKDSVGINSKAFMKTVKMMKNLTKDQKKLVARIRALEKKYASF